MKKIILAILAAPFALAAQLQSGNFLIAPSGAYRTSNTNTRDTLQEPQVDYRTASLTINMRTGYFITDRFAAGLSGQYESSSSYQSYDLVFGAGTRSGSTAQALSYGIFGRMYFSFAGDRLAVFAQLDALRRTFENEQTTEYQGSFVPVNQRIRQSGDGFSFALLPGIAWFAGNHFSVDATIGNISYMFGAAYHYSDTQQTVAHSRFSELTVNGGQTLFTLGFSFYFGAPPLVK